MPTSEAKMVNGGDKMFHIGDKLVIQAQTYDQTATIKELCHLLGEQNIECICAENKALAE